MAGLYTIPENLSKVRILDAGAGSGILSCAFLERLEQMFFVQTILEFPQIVIDKWVCLPKAPVCPIFEMIRMAVS